VGPMVEIEREKVPRRRASRRRPDLRRAESRIRSSCIPFISVTEKGRSRPPRWRVFRPTAGRIPPATMLDCPLNICLSPTRIAPSARCESATRSADDSHRCFVSGKNAWHSKGSILSSSFFLSADLEISLAVNWIFLARLTYDRRRNEINGSVYLLH